MTGAVETAGDRPAVVFDGVETSYRDLDARSSQLARVLIAQGAGPGVIVALALTRSLDSVTAVWAVAKTGAAFVPVDPNYPADRIEYMIDDSGASLGVTIARHRAGLPESATWLVLDEQSGEIDAAPDHPITRHDRLAQPDVADVAYIIYTSGSTGRPKGVVVTHSGLAGVSAAEREHYEVTTESRVLHVCSPSFDVSVLELLLAFTSGATLVVAPATAFGGEELHELLGAQRVTHVLITPGALATVDPSGLPDLAVVVVAGDSFAPELVARWAPGRKFFNGYGPTEATILAVSSQPLEPGAPIVIGTPIPGVGALILDHRLRPVPPGAPGELYLAGVQLARGYHQRPGLTAERFVASPFGEPGERLYRTGDVVRWSDTSTERVIEYVGRNDFQVKIRGFRIELGEIDAALSAHDAVEFAVTVGHTSAAGAVSLVSYVVSPPGTALDTDELTEFVAARLPAYMVPSLIMVLDAIPLTPVGKLDRKALPEPVFAGEGEFEAPRTTVEQVIADVFADVLGLERVGIHDSFFGLGGDSIVSIQVVSRAKARGVRFTPRDVFEHRTVAGIAAIAESADADAPAGPAELAGGGVGTMPLTPIEHFMVDRPGRFDRFNQTVVLELPVGIDRDGIVATLSAVVDAHPMLRARLLPDGVETRESVDVDALVQRVAVGSPIDKDLANEAFDAALSRLDPANGVVVQFVWLDPIDSSGRLIVVAHHLVVDGVSWRIIVPDLVLAWAQRAAGESPALAPEGTSMRAWAHALVTEAARPERVAELTTWESVLAGPDTPLGERAFDPAIDRAAVVRSVPVRITAADTETLLITVPEIFHAGAGDALLAGLALALAKWRRSRGTDETSALVRLEGHGREDSAAPGADLSRTVGWFTSMYPVRLDVAGVDIADAFAAGTSAGAAVQAVKEQLRAIPNNGIGYGLLRYLNAETGPRLPAAAPGQISFNYLGRIGAADIPDEIGDMGWLPAGDLGSLEATPDADMPAMAALDINVIATGGELSGAFAFPDTLLAEADVAELAELWREALAAIATHARTPGAGGRTPSDFRLARAGGLALAQADVDGWKANYPNLIDAWPLAPLQAGLMFHAMLATTSVDVYTVQVVIDLGGPIEAERLRVAGQAVLDRYANLRSAFVVDEAGEPVQLVLESARLPWQAVDLSGDADPDAALARLLDADMHDRFDLAAAPLIRFMLVTFAPDRHKLIVTNHHILVDGWSMPIILKDLLTLYATNGDATLLGPAPSYRNYVSWFVAQDRDASEAAWRDALAGVAEPTLLAPPDAGRTITTLARSHSFALDAAATQAVTAAAAQIGVTINTIVQVAWGLLLGRLLGRNDVVFGTTVSGRPADLPDVESMVGLFINTLPVRIESDAAATIADLLVGVQHQQAGLLGHHFLSLADIHGIAGRGAEFDTLLVYESYPIDAAGIAAAAALASEHRSEERATSGASQGPPPSDAAGSGDGLGVTGVTMTNDTHYPLTVFVTATEHIEVVLQYLDGVFDDDTVASFATKLERIIAAIVAAPDRAVGDIDLLDAAERTLVLDTVNRTEHPVESQTLIDVFEGQVAATPDAPAITFGELTLTYAEFAGRVHRLARHLIDLGVGPEVLVALGMRRSLDLVTAMYAVLAAGGGYVQLDPDHPAERIEHVLETARPLAVLTTAGDNFTAVPAVVVDELDLAGYSDAPIEAAERRGVLRPENTAYVLFTSGSTGRPKGVAVEQRSVVNQIRWIAAEYGIAPADVVLQKTPATFDVSVWELFATLAVGARMVVATADGHRDPEYLANIIAAEQVTMTSFVPSMLSVFAESIAVGAVDSLRSVLIAGEALPAHVVRAFREVSDAATFNLYGPTEFTVHATHAPVPGDVTGAVPIGTPVWNSAAYVLDGRLQPVPIGMAGELYLGGIQVARAYHGRPDLSAERFVADPFGTGARLYRTGDLVRREADGALEYLGRTDFQVKLRGLRIELGEIEALALAHPAVAHAVAVVRSGHTGAEQLVCYLVGVPDVDAVRADLAAQLPEYMVPTAFVVLDELPLTTSGKLDRNALPEPEIAETAYRAADSTAERELAAVFAEVLGIAEIGVDDDFFALGGDSIVSIQLVARAKARGLVFTPRDVFELRTVARIAERAGAQSSAAVTLAELPGGGVGTMPLTPVVAYMVSRGGSFDRFNQTLTLALPPGITDEQIVATLAPVFARHDMLRARLLRDADGEWTLEALAEVDVAALVSSVDGAENAAAALDSALGRLRHADGVVVQFVRVRTGTDAGDRLIVAAHHLVVDGVTWRILITDLVTAWAQLSSGGEVTLPPVGTSMRRWAYGLADVDKRAELPYWRGVLDGPDPQLSARAFDPAIDVAATLDALSVAIADDVSTAITAEVTVAFHSDVADVLLTALALAVAEWRRRRGIDESSTLLRLEGHGREEHVVPGADLTRTIGWFTSMFPLRIDVSGVDLADALRGGAGAGAALKAVKEQVRAVPDKGIGYGVLRYLQDELADAPTPQIGFNYLGRIGGGEEDGEALAWTPVADLGDLPARADDDMPALAALDINAILSGGGLSATFAFPTGLLDRAAVTELADLWTEALGAFVTHVRAGGGGRTPSDLGLVEVAQPDIERWETTYPAIADVWPLSPLQAGFYFHSVLASTSLDVYTSQVVLGITGALDPVRLRSAAQALGDRYANLRTAFVTDVRGAAVQVVLDAVEVPWVDVDLRHDTAVHDNPAALDDLLAADRRERFDLTQPPLLRFTLVRLADDEFRLVVTNHHILLDGWSMPLLLRDLLVFYAGAGAALEPPRSYRRYLEWLADQDPAQARTAWQEALAGAEEPTLLARRDAGDPITALSGEYVFELDETATTGVKDFALAHGVTVNTVLQVAWAIVLGRLVGRDDVVFGATVAGRPPELTGIESMVGLFINTVPVRVQLQSDGTVADLVTRVQAEQAGLMGYHYLGLADIIASSGPGAEFDTLFVYESYPVDTKGIAAAGQIEGMRITDVDLTTVTHYPLTILAVLGARLELTMQFLREVYDEAQVADLAATVLRVLNAMVATPNGAVADIDLLDAAQRTLVLRDWNRTAAEIPAPHTLSGVLADGLARFPESVISAETGSVTYAEFAARANGLARWLIEQGVGPETRVAISMRRSLDMLTALYAVAAAGGAYVVVDPDHPADRTAYVLEVAAPAVVLRTLDDIDLTGYSAAPLTDADRLAPVRPENTAYVLFTSGSTGRPKGVVVRNAAVVNQLRWLVAEYALSPADVVLLKTPATFDVSVWELFGTIVAGARLVIATPDGHRDPAYLARVIAEEQVTITSFVPSMLSAFAGSVTARDVASLRALLVAGEALTGATVAAFRRVGTAELHNLYGPTEFTVHATATPVDPDVTGPVPIGRAVWNSAALVLDARLRPVPVGMAGELYMAGAQLARGYDAQPGLTAGAFVANPYGEPGALMYRTGDLVCWNGQGALEYLGRTDFQVKLRGQRIELGEIEAVLAGVDGVSHAAVVVHRGERGDRLVGYVVGAVDPEAVIAEASAHVPAYMVPSAVLTLAAMPLNASGKLDRKALPEPVFEVREFRAPTTPIEELVAATVGEVLSIPRVGLDDGFFDLGGTSISATQVTARLGAALGTQVPVRLLFEAPTVAALAARIESHTGAPGRAPLVAQPRPDVVPLSMAQQRMWFLNRFDPTSALYNIPLAVRLDGRLEVDALRAAIADVVARHEVLRTSYPEVDGTGTQRVHADFRPQIESASIAVADLPARLGDVAATAFDVTAAPPVRVALFELSETAHVLAFVVHHIGADGFSFGPLTRDLMTAYAARSHGSEPGWAPLAVQYADYSLWQQAVFGAADDPESLLAQQESFWRTALAGIPDQLDLPADRARPAVATNLGANVVFAVSPELRTGLADVARRQDATLFMVLHGALAVLAARLSGTSDIVIGTPIAGRGEAALDDLVGMFVNTLALRTDVDPNQSFAQFLRGVRTTDIAAFGHADLPFERLVDVLDPARSQARHPLFQVALTFQNMATDRLALPGLDVSGLDLDVVSAKFDLQLTVAEDPSGGLAAIFTYATDLFDDATVRGFADRLVALLEGIVAADATAVGDLPFTTAAEQRTVLRDWNIPGLDVGDDTLLDLFELQASRRGDAPAVRFAGADLSYRELDDRASALAGSLVAAGVGPESLVAIATERGPGQLIAMLATLKAGGGYLPLDVTYPADRLSYILTDAHPAAVLTTDAELSLLPEHDVPVVLLDGEHTALAGVRPTADNIAYVIYTSGSTGRPKGVAVTHRNAVELLTNSQQHFGFDATDVWTMFHSFAFDFSVWEIWGALAYGGVVVVVDYVTSRSPEQFRELLARERVTVLNQTPSAFYQLMEADRGAADELALRYVIFGGEALDLRALRRWYERHPAVSDSPRFARPAPQLVNMYGITETTVHVSYLALDAGMAGAAASVIGRALPGLSVYVLDERLHPVPVGVPGDVYVSGGQLSRGYVGRPDLTFARFLANPFGVGRMYRTGDVARWNAAGQLEYAGRSDQQVQLRGFRIEMGEIEGVLDAYPGVASAVATVRTDERFGDRLIGYVVPEAVADVQAAAVREFASGRLAAYMVPDAVVVLAELPLTPNGKLDRKALPEPDFASTATFREPATPIEQAVAGVFADLLGVERVGLDDDFFALGGNSLVATRVVARVNAAVDAGLGVRDLFEASTVEGLAARASAATGAAGVPLTRVEPRPDVVPLSLAQQRMWVLNQLDPNTAVYNIPLAIELTGAVDVPALQQALLDVVARHETLRTSYPVTDGVPRQRVHSLEEVRADVALEVVTGADIETGLRELAATGFDVTAGVPVRARLFETGRNTETGADTYVFALVVHHICADGASVGPLAQDLIGAYLARTAGAAPTWRELSVQYADFAIWQRETIGDDTDPESIAHRQLEFWRQNLAGLPERLDLPMSRPRPREQSMRGAAVSAAIPEQAHVALNRIAREHNASLFMVVHAALAVLLARLSGTTDIAIGTPIAGRGVRALDDLVGMFVNTLALRTAVDPGGSFAELVDHARETDLSAFGNADIPFERVAEIQNPTRTASHHPVFQVALAFQNLEPVQLELPDLAVRAVQTDQLTAKFDLQVTIAGDTGGSGDLDLVFTYATDLFDESVVDAFARRFLRILDAVAADSAAIVGDIDIFDAEDFAATPSAEPTTVAEVSSGTSLSSLLLASVEEDPEAPAAVSAAGEQSYRALDQQSSQLARALIERGVGPGDGVVLGLERSFERAVATWAVVKAGGQIVADGIESGAAVGIGSGAAGVAWLAVDDAAVTSASGRPVTYADRLRPLQGSDPLTDGLSYDEFAATVDRARAEWAVDGDSGLLRIGAPEVAVLEVVLAGITGAVLAFAPADAAAEELEELWVTHVIAGEAELAALDADALAEAEIAVVTPGASRE